MAITSSKKIIDKQLILAKAFFNTGEQLNLSLTQLAAILNISEAKIKDCQRHSKIDPFDLVLSFNLGLNPNSFFILQTITLTRYLYHMTVMQQPI